MPKEGQKSVTLREDVYLIAKQNAEKHNAKSVASFVTQLILENTKKEG